MKQNFNSALAGVSSQCVTETVSSHTTINYTSTYIYMTQTGGGQCGMCRSRIAHHLCNRQRSMFAYGDGQLDVLWRCRTGTPQSNLFATDREQHRRTRTHDGSGTLKNAHQRAHHILFGRVSTPHATTIVRRWCRMVMMMWTKSS